MNATMPKTLRTRIDYMPGPAALEALGIAAEMFPDLRQQVLLDKLMITGLVALHWRMPALYGRDRDAWRLPADLHRGNPDLITAKNSRGPGG